MTAIAGVFDRAPGRADDVAAMLDRLLRRGPVNRRSGRSDCVDMGAAHLVDREPEGFHTLADSQGVWMACADARLDNAPALRGLLDVREGTAALILAAYRRWGASMLEHLSGDFAFAVWDPCRQRVFFARDRFGVMPFVYRQTPGRFVFSSEPKAILALPDTPRRVPRLRMAEFLAGQAPPETETMFADIQRLPAAHCGWAGHGVFQTQRYWRLDLPDRTRSTDPAGEFRDLFDQSVSRRILGGSTVVSMLSGGLDSSSITATAQSLMSDRSSGGLRTLSMVFPRSPTGDERPFIEALLATGDYKPEFVSMEAFDPFAGYRAALQVQDGPVLAPGLTMNRALYRAMPVGGVMLSGHGGDEVVSKGLGHLHDLARQKEWARLWQACGGAADLYGTSRKTLYWSLFERFGPGRYKIRAMKRLLARLGRGSGADASLLSPALSATYSDALRGRTPIRPVGRSGRGLDLDTVADPLQAHALEILDRESSDAGIESRYPFWDLPLVQYSLSLDPSTKLKQGWTRMVLREAMTDRLPAPILWRRDKHDFSPFLIEGLLTSPCASSEALAQERDSLGAYIDLAAVEAARERLMARPIAVMDADVQTLWRTTALSIWIQHCRENDYRLL